MIYTTNLKFSRWPSVIGDTTMASAIIDRTVHHGRILRTSWRLKNAAMK
ncbi:ATP-binding protein [Trueperella pyogenes]|nr:ATP-binding protein [Trueperella pyogenes]WHU60070.1 ATP-binding protein [Trueperella pyogenes]